MHADKIIVLNEGEVVGIGTHRELLENCPIYYDIMTSQLSEGGISMKQTLSSLKRLARYIKPYQLTFFFVLLFTVLTVIFNVALPYVVGLPTTEISHNIANNEAINFSYIFNCLIWITIVGVGYCVSQLLSGVLMTNVVQSAMQDLRRDIEEKINRLPVSYFDKNQQGNILSRVTNDVDAVSGALQQAFIGVVNAILGITLA